MLAILFVLLPSAGCHLSLPRHETVDVHRDDIQQMASFALGELNSLSGSQNTLVKVVSAEVFEPSIFTLSLQLQQNSAPMKCHVSISLQHDPPMKLIHHNCSTNGRNVIRRSFVTVDKDRTDVKAMVNFALSEINKQNKTQWKLKDVTKASIEISSHTEYKLEFRTSDGTFSGGCSATVQYIASNNAKKMTSYKCTYDFKFTSWDVNSETAKKVAKFALNQINGVDETQFQLDEIVSFKTPSIINAAFENYYLVLRMSENGKTKMCNCRVAKNFGLNQLSLAERHCSNLSKRQGDTFV